MMKALDVKLPRLGFGLMRLPKLADGVEIDVEQVKEMVDCYMAAGCNYFDTAYSYDGGRSEAAAREAIVKRYPRESFFLATKLPGWAAKDAAAARQMLQTSLARTEAGYIDFYLLHNLGPGDLTEAFDRYGLWDFCAEMKEKGLIKHFGFSIHDDARRVDKALSEHPEVDFIQLQLNWADWESEKIQSRLCHEAAVKHGKPIIVMEPVKGGMLSHPPQSVYDVFDAAEPGSTAAKWALRFAASLENVVTVLSGMSTKEQVEENVRVLGPGFSPLSQQELAVIDKAQQALAEFPIIPCTKCGYCVEECPHDIPTPAIINALNLQKIYNDDAAGAERYYWDTEGKAQASDCIACGLCEDVCPQHLPIIELLSDAAENLEGKFTYSSD